MSHFKDSHLNKNENESKNRRNFPFCSCSFNISFITYHTCEADISFSTPHPPQAVPLLPLEKAFLSYFRSRENISYSCGVYHIAKAIYHTEKLGISFPRVSFPCSPRLLPLHHSSNSHSSHRALILLRNKQ